MLLLEKLETPLMTHMRTVLAVMMAIETLLLPTRAVLSLTLTIVVVAVVVALVDAETRRAQVLLLLLRQCCAVAEVAQEMLMFNPAACLCVRRCHRQMPLKFKKLPLWMTQVALMRCCSANAAAANAKCCCC